MDVCCLCALSWLNDSIFNSSSVASGYNAINAEIPWKVLQSAPCKILLLKCGSAYLSKKGINSSEPGVFLQSLIKSHATANIDSTVTPAARIRSLASSAMRREEAPEASEFAKTV